MMFFRIIPFIIPRWWNRAMFTVRYFSAWLSPRPHDYVVAGEVKPEHIEEFARRLVYYLGGEPASRVAWRRDKVWKLYAVHPDGLKEAGAAGWWRRASFLLLGRILLASDTPRARMLERMLWRKFYLLDWTGTYRFSAWRWTASVQVPRPRETFAKWRHYQHTGGNEVVILGNGPSAELVFSEPYAHLPVIVCNTAVKSARLRPRIAGICIADALYFVAPTPYTRVFHGALREALAQKPFPVVIDGDHEEFYRRHCPWIPPQDLLPVIMEKHAKQSADFRIAPVQYPQYSVFPGLMLPFAASFYQKLYLIGFDGKDPNAKNYFWRHSDEFQFHGELPSVKTHDLGFFAGNDDDFYNRFALEYSNQLEVVLTLAEKMGREIIMTHPSFVPSLARRYRKAPEAAPAS